MPSLIRQKSFFSGFWLVVISIFSTSTLFSQEPKSPPGPKPAKVDPIQKWEEAVRKIQRLECQVETTFTNQVFGGKQTSRAEFQLVKTKPQQGTRDYFSIRHQTATLSLIKVDDRSYGALYGSDQKTEIFYTDLAREKEHYNQAKLREIPNPEAIYQFESALFFSDPKSLINRYEVKVEKEDEGFYYINLFPFYQVDRNVFCRAKLILDKFNSLPRQIRWETTDGYELVWDVKTVRTKTDIQVKDVLPPNVREPRLKNREEVYSLK